MLENRCLLQGFPQKSLQSPAIANSQHPGQLPHHISMFQFQDTPLLFEYILGLQVSEQEIFCSENLELLSGLMLKVR